MTDYRTPVCPFIIHNSSFILSPIIHHPPSSELSTLNFFTAVLRLSPDTPANPPSPASSVPSPARPALTTTFALASLPLPPSAKSTQPLQVAQKLMRSSCLHELTQQSSGRSWSQAHTSGTPASPQRLVL